MASTAEHDGGQALVPQLPPAALVRNSSIELYIVPAEDTLFVQGFKPVEYELRPPCLLRGLLVVRVLRLTKIKSITLNFKGIMKTDWPEGIPPKRNTYEEITDLVRHSWPFYQVDLSPDSHNAHMYLPCGKKGLNEAILMNIDTSPSHLSGGLVAPFESASSFAANLIKRAANSPLATQTPNLTPVTSSNDLHSMMSVDNTKPGTFLPGDYVYNFEHLIPALSLESIRATFGTVEYFLEAVVSRQGTFRPGLRGKLPIYLVRVPMDNSVEENEPIVIERDWEEHLRYEIMVASKSVVLDSYLPMSFKFIPLHGKVALHRIRVFIIEECNYYCQNKKVHRLEPSRKFLLLEHKASKSQSLLNKNKMLDDSPNSSVEVLPRDLEFQMFVPYTINKKFNLQIHPDTAVKNIQCTHWIKICLRLSRPNPNNGGKRKHFEISIDSPIHLYSPLAAHNRTLLPIYEKEPEFLPQYIEDSPLSPDVAAINVSNSLTPSNLPISSGGLMNMLIPRDSSAIEFQHITSPTNVGYAEIDGDLHLDSNLYRPEDDSAISRISAPQATAAYSPLASPTRSPSTRTLAPTSTPPLFSSLGTAENILPPAYDRLHGLSQSSLSLNPLTDPANDVGINSQSIKNRLNEQFLKVHRKSISCQSSMASDFSSSKSKDNKNDSNSVGENFLKLGYSIHGTSLDHILETTPEIARRNIPIEVEKHEYEQDGLQTLKRMQNNYPTVELASRIGDSSSASNSEVDIADSKLQSQCSSVSLSLYLKAGLDDLHIDQTLPLLALSTTTLNDTDLQVTGFESESVTDLVGGIRFDNYHFNDSLSQLRSPRLESHYQELTAPEELKFLPREREHSFGVVTKTPQP